MKRKITRRSFLAATAAASVAGGLRAATPATPRPALLGGKPVRTAGFASWPVFDEREEQAILKVLRSGRWNRGPGHTVEQFEEAYAQLTGAKHCLATTNGTSSLIVALIGCGVEAGDEVIVPPYTFIATVNAVLMLNALPVFVDTDPRTFQIDAGRIEAAITDRTTAILPVHLGGNAADMDAIMALSRQRKLPVIEDACQSHLAEWKGKKVGTLGTAGCFSFQATKNLNCGEGGAILTDDPDVAERCYSIHTNGRTRRQPTSARSVEPGGWSASARTANFRMNEFQAALLLAQMTRLEEQSRTRSQNAQYLTGLLRQIPGIVPAAMYEGCTRNAYHLYMFRYEKEAFAGMDRSRFLRALDAEGIPCGGGYTPLNKQSFLKNTFRSRGFQALFPPRRLAEWEQMNLCPQNDRLCEQAVWFTQPQLLGPRQDMDQIAEAIGRIHAHAGDLARA